MPRNNLSDYILNISIGDSTVITSGTLSVDKENAE